ncbi:glycosyltransferase family 2 protein [Ramlibacter tataouinensis]|nr:glycosyltransferase family 2 protein [Ramlibacter tataouinensis]WBY02591.1 glycosyltransferase family 2 protein [Ramlibacter tataouinensis]
MPVATGSGHGQRRSGRPSISCVIPCRNEASNLRELLPQLQQVLAGLAPEWEVVLVDDGSTDSTSDLLALWTQRPGFRLIELSRHFGKEAALTAGLEAAAGEVVVIMDADLQHPPQLLPGFLQRWAEGADIVYAVRASREDESRFKRLGTSCFYWLLNGADRFDVPAGAGDFRLMDRKAVDALLALPERNRFMKGLYAWVGFDAVPMPYMPPPRAHGTSHFGALRLVRLSLDGLTAFTTWPLRAVSILGFALALLAFLYGSYLIVAYLLHGHVVSGWTTIVVSLMFVAGIQLVSLGVVGEYVGRVFEEVKARPLFVVRRQAGRGLGGPRP